MDEHTERLEAVWRACDEVIEAVEESDEYIPSRIRHAVYDLTAALGVLEDE